MDEVKVMISKWEGMQVGKFTFNDFSLVCEIGYLFLRIVNLSFESD